MGSSKGGYSALYYSTLIEGVQCVIGVPQYFLADYLNKIAKDNLRFILGETFTDQDAQDLNELLRHQIKDSDTKPRKVYLHYSSAEHTYEEHIQYMLNDLIDSGIDVATEVCDYTNHSDLAIYFPDFLKKSIKEIINES